MLTYNGPKKTFIQFLDEYPIHYCLHPADFFNIIRITNIDYSQNQYSDNYFTHNAYSENINNLCPVFPSPIKRNGDPTKKKKSQPSITIDTVNCNWSYENSHLVSENPDAFSPINRKDNTPIATEILEITDPINTISDLIAIIDKYDVTKSYNIDIQKLKYIYNELVDLNAMVGMESLKLSILNQLIYFIQGLHLHPSTSDDASMQGDFKHTVLYGPPGTGKTEVAKIIGKMYSNLGVLQKGIFKKVTRNDLVAGYLGQTAIKTKNVITECLGGVLFIDEAYSLSNSNDLDSFSKECIDTLCESLSDHKKDLMVIIAGYEEDLESHFFSANRGLDSRFVWRFKIDSYNATELSEIFQKKIRENGWEIDNSNSGEKVVDVKWFERNKTTFRHFGRDMEMLFLYTKISHSRRVFGKPKAIHRKLTKLDIENGYALFLKNTKKMDDTSTRNMLETMYI